MALFLAKAINIIMLFKAKLDLWTLSPPSLPSPTGEVREGGKYYER
jgi:hypothetical protein